MKVISTQSYLVNYLTTHFTLLGLLLCYTAFGQTSNNTCSPITGSSIQSCNSIPLMAVPCYINGNPLAGGNAGTSDAFVIFNSTNFGNTTPPQKHLPASQLGTVWGVAMNPVNSQIYTSAFLKRHMGFGQYGPGAIYHIDPTAAAPTASLFIDLAQLGINVGTDPRTPTDGNVDGPNELSASTTAPSWDVDAFALIGKMALGGLDISTDGTRMYVMNLYEKKLVVLNISGNTPTLIGSYPVPNPNCSNGDYAPWAVKYHNDKVYVGVVCTAETSQALADMKATIYQFDNTTNSFCEVFGFPLDYPRGIAGGAGGSSNDPAEWQPWTNTLKSVSATFAPPNRTVIYPQAILSDIEFDVDGSMIVALMDRNGHQVGNANFVPTFGDNYACSGQTAGDILRIGKVGTGYQLENNGQINGIQADDPNRCYPSSPLNGLDNQQGPGGGEYYWGDNYLFNPCNPDAKNAHDEICFGGLALIPGSGEVAMTCMDPTETANSGGIAWLNNITGKRKIDEINFSDASQYGYRLYDPTSAGNFGKASGLGDIETFCLDCTATISNPSANQTLCVNSTGANITVNTNNNNANGIRFVKFTADQIAGTSPTGNELAAIYGGTVLSTATPSGTASPFTATYTWNNADFPNATAAPITYHVYAILNPDMGTSCRPVQEIVITINPLPTANNPIVTDAICLNGAMGGDGSILINNILNGNKYSFNTLGGTGLTYSSANNITGNTINITGLSNAATTTNYTIRIYNGTEDCYKDIQVVLPAKSCCKTKNCFGVKITRD